MASVERAAPIGVNDPAGAKRAAVVMSWASELLEPAQCEALGGALRQVFAEPAAAAGFDAPPGALRGFFQPAAAAVAPKPAAAASSSVVDLTNTSDESEAEDADESGGEGRWSPVVDPSMEDDGLEIVEHLASEASCSVNESVTVTLLGDEACVVSGRSSSAIESLPHARADCVLHVFAPGTFSERCAMCYCYACDKPAADCTEWKTHCEATHADLLWREEREQRKASQPRQPDVAAAAPTAAVVPAAAAATPAVARPTLARATSSTTRQVYAVAYVALVKETLAVPEPATWKKFLAILRKYREQGKTSDYVLEHLNPLFQGKPQLLACLHSFIKPSAPSPAGTVAPASASPSLFGGAGAGAGGAAGGRFSAHSVSPPSDASSPSVFATTISGEGGGGGERIGEGGEGGQPAPKKMRTIPSFFPDPRESR